MIREDRELLAELARLNTAMASLALRIMDGSAGVAEQQNYAQRLIEAGKQLQRRADEMQYPIIEGELLADVSRIVCEPCRAWIWPLSVLCLDPESEIEVVVRAEYRLAISE